MNTLRQIIEAQKIRKGPATGTNKQGAYWSIEKIQLRNSGGDGIGQSSPDVKHFLDLRHFRNGDIQAKICRHAWHQNGAWSGGGDNWLDVSQIVDCQTIEQVICVLKGVEMYDNPVICSDPLGLVETLRRLGLVDAEKSPDEV
jgi:hypothetical protein